MTLASISSSVVEQSPHDLKLKGLNAVATGSGREIVQKWFVPLKPDFSIV
jgi:hypothetical protein